MKLYTEGPEDKALDIYSPEGMRILADLWVKTYLHNKLTHDITWLGRPIIQFPEDVIMMQELIWAERPDAIVETGIAHGGSAVFHASMLELLGRGEVYAVDIDIRAHNRVEIEKHPQFSRIHLFEGSSVDQSVFDTVAAAVRAGGHERPLVVLDSCHSRDHVRREMELYGELVPVGSYMVVMDGVQRDVWDIPRGKPEWREDHPLAAIEAFLADHPGQWEVDERYTRLLVTTNPRGFLRRVA